MNRHLFAVALCGAVGLTAACGSGSNPVGPPGTGGVSGTGEVSASGGVSGGGGIAGRGGITGTGGTAGGGGVAGTGGAVVPSCNASNTTVAPASGQIANFMGGAGTNISGGVFSLGPVMFTTSGGFLHLTPPPGFGLVGLVSVFFDTCIDATAFNGVQFSISGSSSGCTIEYKTEDSAQLNRVYSQPPFGAGLGDCSDGDTLPCGGQAATITAAQITMVPQTLRMPFVGGPFAGSPKRPLDKTRLVQVLWQFTGSPSCVTDIAIDDISFY